MNVGRLLGVGAFLCGGLVVACGDDTGTGASSSNGGSGTGGTPAEGGMGTGGEPAGGSAQGGASGGLSATIYEATLIGSCKPVVAPDPVDGTFSVDYVNEGTAPGELTITEATLELEGTDSTLSWTFDATPTSSGMLESGGFAGVLHTKMPGSGSGGDPGPCGYCGAPGSLTVTWSDGDGGTVTSSIEIDAFECAL